MESFFLLARRAVSIYKPGEESMLPAGLLGHVQGPWLTLGGPAQHRGGTGGDSGRAQCWTCPCSVSKCSWSKANSWSCNRLWEQGAHRMQLGAEGTGYTLFSPLFVPMVLVEDNLKQHVSSNALSSQTSSSRLLWFWFLRGVRGRTLGNAHSSVSPYVCPRA